MIRKYLRSVGLKTFWAGLGIEFLGIIGDTYWHSIHGTSEIGIPPAHWLTLAGMAVVLFGIVGARREATDWRYPVFTVGILAALTQLIGGVWDNVLHATGREPAVWALPHTLYRIGFLLILGVALVTFFSQVREQG